MDRAALERALRDADAGAIGAIFVHPRVLRRVIKRHRRLPGLGLDVPHAASYVLAREALVAICDEADLGHEASALPRDVILLAKDGEDDEDFALLARRSWQQVFHCHVHHALDALALSPAALRARVNRIGQTEFDEIRFVLRQDDRLVAPGDDAATYAEFAATYLELRTFAPDLLDRTFPALSSPHAIDATLALDLDAAALLARCRPDGALTIDELSRERVTKSMRPERDSIGLPRRWTAEHAQDGARPTSVSIVSPAGSEVDTLVRRIARALRWQGAIDEDWNDALTPLLELSKNARTPWNVEARLLHDLERACVDAEREIFTVDVVGAARSLGARAVRRPLPKLREVRIVKHMRAALAKVAQTHVPEPQRSILARALRDCVERAEVNLRASLRPEIERALDEVGLVPESVPERVAAKKLVDELIDHVVEHGRLSLGQLRDALSRSHLKLGDLSGPMQLLRGDAVLGVDDRLARSLDGVYRRGEIYLRFLQRVSSLAFGTPAGRFLTRYLFLPFGTAFVGLEGAQHIVGPFCELVLHREEPVLFTPASFLVGAAIVFALLHSAVARSVALAIVRAIGAVVRAIFFDAPHWLWRTSLVQAVVTSAPARLVSRWLVKPLVMTALLWGALRLLRVRLPPEVLPVAGAIAFVLWNIALNTKAGARVEEAATDWVIGQWRHLRRHVLPGLFALIANVFRSLVEQVERALYAVDAFLLSRKGESAVVVFMKGAAGIVWFFASYLVRVYVNLLIEPQINPIKHFPVVTVAAKIMLPMAPTLIRAMRVALHRVFGRIVARTFAAPTVFLMPGFFGFLVWELKENWKLYRANRKRELAPVSIGHHGETMAGLLTPGFHSGTIPKAYAKLRRAAWKGKRSALAHREALHHIEEAIRRFVERELVTLLAESPRFPAKVEVGHIEIASNRVRIELLCSEISAESAKIAFEEQSGWLLASIARAGFIAELASDQRIVLENALAGFYKMADVHLVREQIAASLDDPRAAYDVSSEGLVVWPGGDYERESVRPLDARSTLFFRNAPIAWSAWAASWDAIAEGNTKRLLTGASLLPSQTSEPRA